MADLGSLAVLAVFTAYGGAAQLHVAPRRPLWVAVQVPAKDLGATSLSRLIEIATTVIHDESDLRPQVVNDAVLERCSAESRIGATACLVKTLREDEAPGEVSRFLLVVSAVRPDELLSLLIDSDEVLRVLEESGGMSEADRYAEISRRALVASTLPTHVSNEADVTAYLRKAFEEELQPILKGEPLGELEVALPVEDEVGVVMDGRRIGRAAGSVTIADVPLGHHALEFESEGAPVSGVGVDVTTSERMRVEVPLGPPPGYVSVSREAVLYGGLVAAAAGVGVLVASFLVPAARDYCTGDGPCTPSEFKSTGGVLLGPLGYSLAGLGTAWSLGAWLGDERSFPWIRAPLGRGGVRAGIRSERRAQRERLPLRRALGACSA